MTPSPNWQIFLFADAFKPSTRADLNRMQAAVLDAFVAFGPAGATDEAIQTKLRIKSQSQIPRRLELLQLGLIEDTGRRVRTASGRMAIVWRAIDCRQGGAQ